MALCYYKGVFTRFLKIAPYNYIEQRLFFENSIFCVWKVRQLAVPLNNDPGNLIPTCKPVSTTATCSTATVSNTEANFHFPSGNPATVALYVGDTVNVNVNALVQRTINRSGILALRIVESKIPPLTAGFTPSYPDVTHVNHTKVWFTPRLDKDALLELGKTNHQFKLNVWGTCALVSSYTKVCLVY